MKSWVLALAFAVAAFVGGAAAENGRGEPKPLLLYVGAWNCGPCAHWEGNELPKLQASAAWSRLDFRKVSTPMYQRIDEDDYWPSDLRWIRDSLGLSRGTPRFILVSNGRIVAQGYAGRGWREVLEQVKSITRDGA